MEHPIVEQDSQLHAHNPPEAIWKATLSIAPAASVHPSRRREGAGNPSEFRFVHAPLTVGVNVNSAAGNMHHYQPSRSADVAACGHRSEVAEHAAEERAPVGAYVEPGLVGAAVVVMQSIRKF